MASPKTLPPLLPTVAASLAAPTSLKPWVALSCTLDGRDKITKVCVYTARFLAFYHLSSAPATAAKYQEVKDHLTMSRKAFRIGKFLNEFEKIRVLLDRPTYDPREADEEAGEEGDESVTERAAPPAGSLRTYQKVLSIAKCVGLAGFWTAENILLLTRGASFLYRDDKDSQKSLARTAHETGTKFYFCGSIAFFIMSMRDILNHEKKIAAVLASKEETSDEELEALQKKKFDYYVALTKSICDMIVFSNIAGVNLHKKYRGKALNEGVVSVAGLVSASTVLYNNYPKAK
jgi:hypothetical protein